MEVVQDKPRKATKKQLQKEFKRNLMRELMKKIKKDIDDKGIKIASLAQKSGIDRMVITDGIVTGKTAEMKFDIFLELVPHIYDEYSEQKTVINDFILRCNYVNNIRKMLCYCLCAGELDIIDKLLEKHVNNTKLKKYLTLYGLLNRRNKSLDRGQNRIDLEGIDKQTFATSNECAVLINILYDYSMYDAWDIQAMEVYIEKEEKHIEALDEGYIKKILSVFYHHRMACIDLHNGRLSSCRERSKRVLEMSGQFPMLASTAFCCIGETYIFSDKYQSEKYIMLGLDHLKRHGISNESKKYSAFQTTLGFMYIIHGFKLNEIKLEYLDKSEYGLFEGLHGDRNKGIKILEEVITERPSSPYGWFYLAYVKQDRIGLYKALEMFESRGNYHYATGVKMALKSLEMEVEKT